MPPYGNVLLHYIEKQVRNTISNEHVLLECVKFVQRNLKILFKTEKEKKLCGGVLFVNIGNVFCAGFFPGKFHCFFSNYFAFLYTNNAFMFIFR
jgi:hypothetical protein